MKKKVLILGTNAGQADIIEYLNLIGWQTHACGYKRIGPGCDLADHFHAVNIVDVDAVKKLAISIEADLVYSISSDLAITTATKVSELLNLPTLLNSKTIDLFNNKDAFRKFLNDYSIGNVSYVRVGADKKFSWSIFPCVVKPVDSQGQRGVSLVKTEEELLQAIDNAIESSITNTAIVEEFLDGAEFSTNVIVQNGEIIINEFSDRIVFEESFFGLPKGHAIPPTYINEQQHKIAEKYVYQIVEALKIVDAVLYVQMKLSNGVPKIIEIAPRLDGCHLWRLIKTHRNIDLREFVINLCLGQKIIAKIESKEESQSVLEFYHLPTSETFFKSKLDKRDNVSYNEYRYEDGDAITPINGKLEVVGYCVYSKADNK